MQVQKLARKVQRMAWEYSDGKNLEELVEVMRGIHNELVLMRVALEDQR
jgi:predicted house-cleaning noncanonical NTP pyrophosphatase (MazG superfamily)